MLYKNIHGRNTVDVSNLDVTKIAKATFFGPNRQFINVSRHVNSPKFHEACQTYRGKKHNNTSTISEHR